MKTLQSFLESKEEHHVVAFGRMSPPTAGHEKMLDAIHKKAKEVNGKPHMHLSQTQDAKKNPLHHDDKVNLVKKMMPHHAHMIHNEKHVKTFIDVLKHHSNKDHHLHIVAGGDRVDEYHKLAHKYNGKDYHYKSITVHSAGHRDPDAEGAEGISATKLRNHAHAGEFEHFKKGLPSTTSHEVAKHAYHAVRKGLKLEEALLESFTEELITELKPSYMGADDTKDKAKKLIGKFKKVFIANALNREKELETKYGPEWKKDVNNLANVRAYRAYRGKKFKAFIDEAVKEKKKKTTKVIINPSTDELNNIPLDNNT